MLSLAIGQQGIVKPDVFNFPLFDQILGQQAILPLPAAATTGDTKVVASLLKIIPNVNEQYSYALHAASSKGHLEVVQLLLKAGTDVNTRAGNLGSALQAALRQGHDRVVQSLLDAGADLSVSTLEGHTAFGMGSGILAGRPAGRVGLGRQNGQALGRKDGRSATHA